MTQDNPEPSLTRCAICGQTKPANELLPITLVRPAIAQLLHRDFPQLSATSLICNTDRAIYQARYVQYVLETEKGAMSSLEEEVIQSLRDHDLITTNLEAEFTSELTFGQRLSDRLAAFGGSWSFLISFGCVMLLWIVINTWAFLREPFDPYPFILLNLVLSCLAAIQAPVIMMSQNRQEAKDRLRSENDYRINLKAELEIRHLNAKMDLLMMHQWQRLLEIQQVQTDLIQELLTRNQS